LAKNLLENGKLRSFVASKWFPGIFQYPIALIFIVIVFELLFGHPSPGRNFGTAMTWVLWWPVIPLMFLLLGRFWCAVCPFATLSDLVQKWVGNNRPVPVFLKKYGIWIIDAAFILITWADHIFGIVESPQGSAVLLLLLVTGAVAAGSFYERRTWCRYLCFLGGLSGNYSRAGILELRGTPEKCAKCKVQACFKGSDKAAGCPMFEFPRAMDDNAKCNLCGNCVKSCPNDSIRLSLRAPSKELWFIKKPRFEESFLAIVIMGIVFIQNITMLELGTKARNYVEGLTGLNSYLLSFTITFVIAMAIPVLALYVSSRAAGLSNGEPVLKNVALFGYALIPLDLAGHLGHNLFHLLAEIIAVLYTGAALFGISAQGSTAVVGNETIKLLQFMLIGLGTVLSAYTAYRIAKYNFSGEKVPASVAPFICLIIILALVNIYLFNQPMEHRM